MRGDVRLGMNVRTPPTAIQRDGGKNWESRDSGRASHGAWRRPSERCCLLRPAWGPRDTRDENAVVKEIAGSVFGIAQAGCKLASRELIEVCRTEARTESVDAWGRPRGLGPVRRSGVRAGLWRGRTAPAQGVVSLVNLSEVTGTPGDRSVDR